MKRVMVIITCGVLVSACIQGTTARQIGGMLLRSILQDQLLNSHAISQLVDRNYLDQAANDLQTDVYNDRIPESVELECYDHESDEQCVDRNKSQVERNLSRQINLDAFDQAYESCHDSINTDASIDLDDHVKIYEVMVSCLSEKGFSDEVKVLTRYAK